MLCLGAPVRADDVGNPHGTYAEDCALCHSKDAWKPASISPKFDHGKYAFKLTGAHAGLDCRSCHVSLDFKKAGTNCVDCHQDIHKGELGLDCALCHTTRNFIERAGDVRRHRLTRFPLMGAHAAADCSACHKVSSSGHATYVNTPTDCETCHLSEFNAAKNPDHVASGFSHDCSQCHAATAWLATAFNHAALGFPLNGAHASLACSACHLNNQFTKLPTDCASCHSTNYQQTTMPPHPAAQFGTNCLSCHSTKAWIPSTWSHASTGFSLTGSHKTLDCTACHLSNVYTGLNSACVSCHQSQYDATTNPAHAGAGFSTDCASCHTTVSWQGATFNHDAAFFPIYSGRHAGLWSTCAVCHINPASYADFSCFGCHPHSDKSQTDGNHSGVKNYVYDSQACYSCHPRGRAGN
jgi:hypothetical protein